MNKLKKLIKVALVATGIAVCAPLAQAKIYDLEHHFYVPEFLEYMATRTTPPRFIPGDPESSNPFEQIGRFDIGQKSLVYIDDNQISNLTDFTEARIAAMDAAGVDVAVLSTSSLIEALPREKAIELTKLSNDRVYEMSTNFPGRILGSATLPTVWVDDATNELERCVKELGFKYWHTQDHYVTEDGQTNYLWEAKFAPLLARANELGVAIYIHPEYQSQPRYDYGMGYMGAMLGFGQGVMATATKFIIKGKLDEYPNIRLILGHMGEYFPYVLERMDNRFFNEVLSDPGVKCQKKFSEYFKEGRIFVTTSGNRSNPALQCARRAIGIEHIAYGSDWPYETMDSMSAFIKDAKLTDAEREQLTEKTATERIFVKDK